MSESEFKVIGKLGQGSFGTVYEVKRLLTSQHYAMKKVKLTNMKEKQKNNALNEIRLLASVDHPNIISYKQAFYDEETSNLCMVMELAHNGDLAKLIKNKNTEGQIFYEYEIWNIGGAVIKGLLALHERKILHRDLKPANIFFDKNNVPKLGDMNVSKVMENNLAFTQTGTPYYASPQVWRNQPYGYECDIWSFGCILYEMCCLKSPFKDTNIEKLYEKVKNLKYQQIPSRFSEILSDTISRCLRHRDERIELKELQKLFHRYTAPKVEKNIKFNNEILRTIKMPLDEKLLKGFLPKQKYQEEKNPQLGILHSFLKKGQMKPRRQEKKEYINSEKIMKSVPKSIDKYVSFKNVLSPKEQVNKNCLNRINLRRRRLRIALNL